MSTWQKVTVGDVVSPVRMWVAPEPLPPDILGVEDKLKELDDRDEMWCPKEGEIVAFDVDGSESFCRGVVVKMSELLTSRNAANKDWLMDVRLLDRGTSFPLQFSKDFKRMRKWPRTIQIDLLPKPSAFQVVLKDLMPAKRGTDLSSTSDRAIIQKAFDQCSRKEVLELLECAEAVFIQKKDEDTEVKTAEIFLRLNEQDNMLYLQMLKNEGVGIEPVGLPGTDTSSNTVNVAKASVEVKFVIVSLRQFLIAKKLALECRYQKSRLSLPLAPASLEPSVGASRVSGVSNAVVNSNHFTSNVEISVGTKQSYNEPASDFGKILVTAATTQNGVGKNSQHGDYLRIEQDPEARPVMCVNKLEEVKLISRGLVQAIAANEDTSAYNAEKIMWPALVRMKSMVCVGKVRRRGYVIPVLHQVIEFRKEKRGIGNRPSVLVVCATVEEALEASSEVNVRLSYCPELNLKSVIVFQDEERARISLMNDHDILVTTLSNVVRLLSLKYMTLDDFRLCVIEDLSSALTHVHTSTVEALMGLNRTEPRQTKLEQFVLLSNEWTSVVSKFLQKNVFIHKADKKAGPILVFTNPKHSAIQGEIATNIRICEEGQKPSILVKATTKSLEQKPKNVVICCEKVDLDSVQEILTSTCPPYDFKMNVVVDGMEDDRDVEADFLIHFGVNKKSPAAFFYRYRLMTKFMRSPYSSSFFSSSSPRCLLLLGPEDHLAVQTLFKFLKPCSSMDVDSYRSFKSLYDFVSEQKRDQTRLLPLCPNLRSAGHCQSDLRDNGDTTCPYRHFLDVNFDSRGFLDLVTKTSVELEVTQVVSPVQLRAKIINIKEKNEKLEKSRSSVLGQLALINANNLVSASAIDFGNQLAASEHLYLCLRRDVFHRAAIVPVTSRNVGKGEVKILLIDEGLEINAVPESLYLLPESLSETRWPRLSVDVFLSGLKPPGGEQKWHSKWLPVVQKKLLECFSVTTPLHYTAKVEFGLSNSIWIKTLQLIQSYRSGCTICVFDMKKFLTSNENLIAVEDDSCNVVPIFKKLVHQENLKIKMRDEALDKVALDTCEDGEKKDCAGYVAEEVVEKIERAPMDCLNQRPPTSAKARKEQVLWSYPESATLPVISAECESGRRVQVLLSELFDPNHFYVVVEESMAYIFELELKLKYQCEQSRILEKDEKKIKLGQAMIARVKYDEEEGNEGGMEYHRAVILALLDDSSVKVQLVDSGHLLNVLKQDLYPLPMEFVEFPCQAIQCSLSNVESDEWSEAAIGTILKEAQDDNEYLTITAASRINSQRRGLASYDVNLLLVDGTDASDTLIKRGHARRREVLQQSIDERSTGTSNDDKRIVDKTAESVSLPATDTNVKEERKEESLVQKSVDFHSVEGGSDDEEENIPHLEKETRQETLHASTPPLLEEAMESLVTDNQMSPQRESNEVVDAHSPINNATKSETEKSEEVKIERTSTSTSSPPPLAWVIDANNSKVPKTPNVTWYEENRDGLTIRIEFSDLQNDFELDHFFLMLATKTICCQYIEYINDREITVYAMQLHLFGSVDSETARWDVNPKGITLKMDKNTKVFWKYLAIYPDSGRQFRANWIRRNMDKLALSDSDDEREVACMENFEYLEKKIANSDFSVPQRSYTGVIYSSSSEVDAKSDGAKSDNEDF